MMIDKFCISRWHIIKKNKILMKHLCRKKNEEERNMKNFPTYSIARKFDVVKCIQFKKSNSVTFC